MTKSGDWWWLSNREAVCVWLAAGWDDGKMCVGPDSGTSECQDQTWAMSHHPAQPSSAQLRAMTCSVLSDRPGSAWELPTLATSGVRSEAQYHSHNHDQTTTSDSRPSLLIRNSHLESWQCETDSSFNSLHPSVWFLTKRLHMSRDPDEWHLHTQVRLISCSAQSPGLQCPCAELCAGIAQLIPHSGHSLTCDMGAQVPMSSLHYDTCHLANNMEQSPSTRSLMWRQSFAQFHTKYRLCGDHRSA